MWKAIRLGLLVTVVVLIAFHYNRKLNPRDEDLLMPEGMEDTLPYNPHRIDSGAPPVDTSAYVTRDTTDFKADYIDTN